MIIISPLQTNRGVHCLPEWLGKGKKEKPARKIVWLLKWHIMAHEIEERSRDREGANIWVESVCLQLRPGQFYVGHGLKSGIWFHSLHRRTQGLEGLGQSVLWGRGCVLLRGASWVRQPGPLSYRILSVPALPTSMGVSDVPRTHLQDSRAPPPLWVPLPGAAFQSFHCTRYTTLHKAFSCLPLDLRLMLYLSLQCSH